MQLPPSCLPGRTGLKPRPRRANTGQIPAWLYSDPGIHKHTHFQGRSENGSPAGKHTCQTYIPLQTISQHALSLLPASMTPYFNSNTLFVINQRWLQSLSSENYCSPRQAQPYIAQNLLYIANEVWSSIDRIVKVKNHNKIGVYTATGTQNHRGVLPKRAGCELQSGVDISR